MASFDKPPQTTAAAVGLLRTLARNFTFECGHVARLLRVAQFSGAAVEAGVLLLLIILLASFFLWAKALLDVVYV